MSKAKRGQQKGRAPAPNVPLRFEQLNDWVRPEEAFPYLHMSRSSMYARLRDGSIPSRKYGNRILIPREALRPSVPAA